MSEEAVRRSALVIDDDPALCSGYAECLDGAGFEAELVADGETAMKHLQTDRYDVVILDLLLPKANGYEVLRFLSAMRPAQLRRVIVVTAAVHGTIEGLEEFSVFAVFRKPVLLDDLLAAVRLCCEQ